MLKLIGDIDAKMLDAVVYENRHCTLSLHPTVYLCSEGGDVGAALAIHDLLFESTVIVSGICASAALTVLAGAKLRIATLYTQFMMHEVTPVGDVKAEHYESAKHLEREVGRLLEKRIGQNGLMEARLLQNFNAATALRLNFVDDVWGAK